MGQAPKRTPGAPPLAPHVQLALAGAQRKAAPSAPRSAPHVEAALHAGRGGGLPARSTPRGSALQPKGAPPAPALPAALGRLAPPPLPPARPRSPLPRTIQRASASTEVPKVALAGLVGGLAFSDAGDDTAKLLGLAMDYFAPPEATTFYRAVGHQQPPFEEAPLKLTDLASLDGDLEYLFVISTEDPLSIVYQEVPISGGAGHSSLADRSLALFAGVMARIHNVLVWSNSSGHYRPRSQDVGQAELCKFLDRRYFIGMVDDDDDEWDDDLRPTRDLAHLAEVCARIREDG